MSTNSLIELYRKELKETLLRNLIIDSSTVNKPYVVSLDQKTLKNDLGFSDQEIRSIYQKVNTLTSENIVWNANTKLLVFNGASAQYNIVLDRLFNGRFGLLNKLYSSNEEDSNKRLLSPKDLVLVKKSSSTINNLLRKTTNYTVGISFKKIISNRYIQAQLNIKIPSDTKLQTSISKTLAEKIVLSKSSKAIMDGTKEAISTHFVKGKNSKYSSVTSTSIKEKKTTKTKSNQVVFNSRYLRDIRGRFSSIIKIKNILNESLHDTIKYKFMGESSEPPIRLRYQTGRFAHSAKVTDVLAGKSEILIKYTYMKFPYKVFAPGGKLHTTERDPTLIIRGAVRDIARQIINREFRLRVIGV